MLFTCRISMTNISLFAPYSCSFPVSPWHMFIANVLCSLIYWQRTYETLAMNMKYDEWPRRLPMNIWDATNEVLHKNISCIHVSRIIYKYLLINHKVWPITLNDCIIKVDYSTHRIGIWIVQGKNPSPVWCPRVLHMILHTYCIWFIYLTRFDLICTSFYTVTSSSI